jgi:hypothetical protein
MGDYDSASADNSYFYTTWGDNRLPDANNAAIANQPDVRFARIPVSEEDPPAVTAAPTAGIQSRATTLSLDLTFFLPIAVGAMPAMTTAVTPVWSAPPVRESSPLAVSGAASASHGQATDAIFAAAGQAATDDGAWLAGSLSGLPVDGM